MALARCLLLMLVPPVPPLFAVRHSPPEHKTRVPVLPSDEANDCVYTGYKVCSLCITASTSRPLASLSVQLI